MAAAPQITDRAKRYRAQSAVEGPRVCVICGTRPERIDVMHLDGNESHGEKANLAYGCRSCNGKLAAAFKKIGAGRPTNQFNPAGGKVPTFEQYAWAVSQDRHSGDKGEHGAIIHATPKSKRTEYAKRILRKAWGTRREAFEGRWNPTYDGRPMTQAQRDAAYAQEERDEAVAAKHAEWVRAQQSKSLKGRNPSAFDKCVESVTKRGGARDPRAVCAAAGRHKYGQAEMTRRSVAGRKRKGNPADASAEVFEEFHGYAPTEIVKVGKKRHHHEWLASAGDLVGLKVRPVGHGLPVRDIEGLGDAILAFNEAKNQLFIEGGDQSMSAKELKNFGITEDHELQTIGKLLAVGYWTDKTHLGDEGGKAEYSHTFRTTNENGRHIVVTIARSPHLIYRVREEQFEISGGSYTIRAEGIDV